MSAGQFVYTPPVFLWSLIEAQTDAHEIESVKNLLGGSLIDQSIELHQEVDLLLEIWRDYRKETDTSLQSLTHSRLPEPPEVRERLVQEIQFFASCIREKSKTKGRDADEILSKQNRHILDYALQETDRTHRDRPMSVRSERDGRQTPMMSGDCPTDRDWLQDEDKRTLMKKIDASQIDKVLPHLRGRRGCPATILRVLSAEREGYEIQITQFTGVPG